MKIIVTGQPKTGTTSTFRALQILGYDVHDSPDTFYHCGGEWIKYLDSAYQPNFKELYQNVDAITDVPASCCVSELLEVFPESKVILLDREEESWLRSMKEELRQVWWRYYFLSFFSPTINKYHRYIDLCFIALYGTQQAKHENLLRKGYRANNQLVKHLVPESQLLVFHVKQGWDPLCKFLGCPVPDQAFPTANALGGKDRCSFYQRGGIKVFQARCEVALSWITLGAGAICTASFLMRRFQCQ